MALLVTGKFPGTVSDLMQRPQDMHKTEIAPRTKKKKKKVGGFCQTG
jgi:hypothetical protein